MSIEKINIENLLNSTTKRVSDSMNLQQLNDIRVEVLGRSGNLTMLLRDLKNLDEKERGVTGKLINDARILLEETIAKKQAILEDAALLEKLENEKIDITIDCDNHKSGALHPINQVKNKITDFFVSLGFLVCESPEIETDYYNFEALNTPADHPARDSQDTFFINDTILLRSHMSAGQIRLMEKTKPPIRMISPGRVYRADAVDATHSPMFHQLEGLVVDKGLTLANLKGILELLAKKIFGSSVTIRFRPSYFPFTEPSVEVDASCFLCCKSINPNCKVCKGTGYIEILGAGMVNKKVLQYCRIDPKIYNGFAFGMGIDRITNILYSISDLRVVFENDIRFLRQFR